MILVKPKCENRIQQGEIFKDIYMIDDVSEERGILEVARISFPYVVVLTQDCDLEEDFRLRSNRAVNTNQDKLLMSVLVAPMYIAEHLRKGEHLSEIGIGAGNIASELWRHVQRNIIPRYHYLEFPDIAGIVPLVIDFKHYFSVNIEYLKRVREIKYVTTIAELFRERVSQRFANFLSRIGLPDLDTEKVILEKEKGPQVKT